MPLKVTMVKSLMVPCNDKETHPWVFFYGAYEGEPSLCGIRAILFIKTFQYLFIKFIVGQGTNNWAYFYALWILLKTTLDKRIKHIEVLGDSKITIDWANQHSSIKNITLNHILNQVQVVKKKFSLFRFMFRPIF